MDDVRASVPARVLEPPRRDRGLPPPRASQIRHIVDIQLERFAARLARRDLSLEVTDRAKDVLAKEGWDPQYGARPLKRAIQRYLEDPLARKVLAGEFPPGTTGRRGRGAARRARHSRAGCRTEPRPDRRGAPRLPECRGASRMSGARTGARLSHCRRAVMVLSYRASGRRQVDDSRTRAATPEDRREESA